MNISDNTINNYDLARLQRRHKMCLRDALETVCANHHNKFLSILHQSLKQNLDPTSPKRECSLQDFQQDFQTEFLQTQREMQPTDVAIQILQAACNKESPLHACFPPHISAPAEAFEEATKNIAKVILENFFGKHGTKRVFQEGINDALKIEGPPAKKPKIAAPTTQVSFELPEEIVIRIFEFFRGQIGTGLRADQLLGGVCRQWRVIIHSYRFVREEDYVVIRQPIVLGNKTTQDRHTIARVFKIHPQVNGIPEISLATLSQEGNAGESTYGVFGVGKEQGEYYHHERRPQTDILTRILATGDKSATLDTIQILSEKDLAELAKQVLKVSEILTTAHSVGTWINVSAEEKINQINRKKFLQFVEDLFKIHATIKKARDYCNFNGSQKKEVPSSLDDSEEMLTLPFEEWNAIYIQPLLQKIDLGVQRLAEDLVKKS